MYLFLPVWLHCFIIFLFGVSAKQSVKELLHTCCIYMPTAGTKCVMVVGDGRARQPGRSVSHCIELSHLMRGGFCYLHIQEVTMYDSDSDVDNTEKWNDRDCFHLMTYIMQKPWDGVKAAPGVLCLLFTYWTFKLWSSLQEQRREGTAAAFKRTAKKKAVPELRSDSQK